MNKDQMVVGLEIHGGIGGRVTFLWESFGG